MNIRICCGYFSSSRRINPTTTNIWCTTTQARGAQEWLLMILHPGTSGPTGEETCNENNEEKKWPVCLSFGWIQRFRKEVFDIHVLHAQSKFFQHLTLLRARRKNTWRPFVAISPLHGLDNIPCSMLMLSNIDGKCYYDKRNGCKPSELWFTSYLNTKSA